MPMPLDRCLVEGDNRWKVTNRRIGLHASTWKGNWVVDAARLIGFRGYKVTKAGKRAEYWEDHAHLNLLLFLVAAEAEICFPGGHADKKEREPSCFDYVV